MSQVNPAAARIARLRAAAINLPTVGFGSPLVLALGAAQAAAQALNLSLAQTAALGGVAAVAVGGVAIALVAFNKGLNDSKKALESALAAQNRYYGAVASQTSQQVRDQIAALQQVNDILQQQISETRNAAQQAFAAAQTQFSGGSATAAGDALARIGTALSGDQLNTHLAELEKQFNTNRDTVTRLTQGLDANAFAANDAADAEQRLASEREKYHNELIALFDADAQMRVKLAALRRNGTSEQVQEQLAANTDQAAVIRNILLPEVESLGLTSEAAKSRTQALNNELDQLTKENELLLAVVLPLIEAREREAAAAKLVTDQYDNYFEALDLEMAAREKLADITRQMAELEEETAERRAQAEDDRAERLRDSEADGADRRIKIIEDSLERIAKIERDYNRSRTDAIRNRDVGALIKAKETAADALEDQRKAQEKSLKSVDEALEKQHRTIQRQYEKQQESINRAYQKRYDQLRYAQQKEEVALQNAINAQIAIALNGSGGLVQIHMNLWASVTAAAHQGMGAVVGAIIDGFNQAISGIGGGAAPIGPGGIGGIFGSNTFNTAVDRRVRSTLMRVWS